jgi:uncharacterized membrane protein YqhA
MSLMKDLSRFLLQRKRFWLLPPVVFLLVIALIFFAIARQAAVAAFIYD